MALVKCRECGREVSSSAKVCPGCGIKKPQPTNWTVIGLVVFVFIIIGLFNSGEEKKTKVKPSPPKTTNVPSIPTETVANNPWDGSVWQVEHYLKKTLIDPDSLNVIECSKVVTVPKERLTPHKYIVICRYRAKNPFGGYVVENKMFCLDKAGAVVDVVDFGG